MASAATAAMETSILRKMKAITANKTRREITEKTIPATEKAIIITTAKMPTKEITETQKEKPSNLHYDRYEGIHGHS